MMRDHDAQDLQQALDRTTTELHAWQELAMRLAGKLANTHKVYCIDEDWSVEDWAQDKLTHRQYEAIFRKET